MSRRPVLATASTSPSSSPHHQQRRPRRRRPPRRCLRRRRGDDDYVDGGDVDDDNYVAVPDYCAADGPSTATTTMCPPLAWPGVVWHGWGVVLLLFVLLGDCTVVHRGKVALLSMVMFWGGVRCCVWQGILLLFLATADCTSAKAGICALFPSGGAVHIKLGIEICAVQGALLSLF